MRYLLIISLTILLPLFYCHAEEKTNEELIKENEALKRTLEELKQQILTSKDNVAMPVSSETEKAKFAREPLLQSPISSIETAHEDLTSAEMSKDEKVGEDIEEFVVTATRTKQPLKSVGSSITVITRKQIENSKAQQVQDVLRQVPGIEVSRAQGIGGTTSIFMRGGSARQTLVFIDGVEVKSTTTSDFNFANLTTDNIERIEILRGPQSTLYGSDAIGGVINIITKRGEGSAKVKLTSEYGTHETYKEAINISGGTEKGDYSASVSYLKTHGIDFSDGIPDSKEEDGYENFTGSVRLGRSFLDDGRADTMLRVSRSDLEFDKFVSFDAGSVDDDDRRQRTDEIFFSARAEKTLLDIWTPSVLVSVYDLELNGTDFDFDSEAAARDAASAGTLPPGINQNLNSDSFRIPTRLWKAEHQSDFNLFDFDTITGGYELEVQEGENEGAIGKQTIYNHAYYIQNQVEFLDDMLNWTVGAREDRHSEFGNNLTYRTAISFNMKNIGLRPHGSWGKGFRAPSINELFFPGFGNQELGPEESKGWDFGIEKEIIKDKLTIDVTYFENDFTDLISFTTLPDGSFQAVNIGQSEAEGIESALTYNPFGWLSLIGTFTHNDTTDRDKEDQLPRRPRRKATFSMNVQPLDKLNINLNWLMVRDRIDSDGSDMDNYWTANLVTRYDISSLISAYVRAENLFNYEYEEVTGFNSLGRTLYGGMELNF